MGRGGTRAAAGKQVSGSTGSRDRARTAAEAVGELGAGMRLATGQAGSGGS